MSFYGFAKGLVSGVCHLLFRIKVVGTENIPTNESFVICANHKSDFDPIMVAISMPVELNFMAKEELFRIKPIAKIIGALGAFPVKRGKSDVGALKSAISILKSGGRLVIFPEGRRSPKTHMGEGKGGAVLIAVKSGVNILPVGINGKYGLFSKITVNIGKPLDLSQYCGTKVDSETIKSITDERLMPEISLLSGVPTYAEAVKKGICEIN